MNAEAKSTIGKFAVIAYAGKCYVANVVDEIAGTNMPKRVRIQYDVEFQGMVLMPSQYTFKEWTHDD